MVYNKEEYNYYSLIKIKNASFVLTSNPWFMRGGGYNATTGAGVFAFQNNNGNAINTYSFRLVL